ncbi:hypothetical protein L484_019548 [Morus notabilis]|uniref:Uncharacterized protein n=1 Tax=Morus notabilis TaxID=981085 RepID=W9R3I7_9ROSA|nr:hypothetical protein L484_019548 [Morus notabilis]
MTVAVRTDRQGINARDNEQEKICTEAHLDAYTRQWMWLRFYKFEILVISVDSSPAAECIRPTTRSIGRLGLCQPAFPSPRHICTPTSSFSCVPKLLPSVVVLTWMKFESNTSFVSAAEGFSYSYGDRMDEVLRRSNRMVDGDLTQRLWIRLI